MNIVIVMETIIVLIRIFIEVIGFVLFLYI